MESQSQKSPGGRDDRGWFGSNPSNPSRASRNAAETDGRMTDGWKFVRRLVVREGFTW